MTREQIGTMVFIGFTIIWTYVAHKMFNNPAPLKTKLKMKPKDIIKTLRLVK